MKKFIIAIFIFTLFLGVSSVEAKTKATPRQKSQIQQFSEQHRNIKEIKNFIKKHNEVANSHDLEKLSNFYAENYINSDGFKKEPYLEVIKKTWEVSDKIKYKTKILSTEVNGNRAVVYTYETAQAQIVEKTRAGNLVGDLYSTSRGYYYLEKINNSWFISGESILDEESKLFYGNAKDVKIDFYTPKQVYQGDSYIAGLNVHAGKDNFVIASIDQDKISHPSITPEAKFRPLNDNELERFIIANKDNANEYVVASLVISKVKEATKEENMRVYVSGLACLMKKVNVVPKNNLINETEKDESNGL